MKLLIDMNLSPLWVEFLEKRGFDTIHWSAVGSPRAPDKTIMEWTRAHSRVILTHDLDFSRLLALTRAAGPSVLQLRTEDVLPSAIGDLVARALEQHSALLQAGAIVVVDPSSSRARILPI